MVRLRFLNDDDEVNNPNGNLPAPLLLVIRLIDLLAFISNSCEESETLSPTSTTHLTLFPTTTPIDKVTCPGWEISCDCNEDCNGDNVIYAEDFCKCQEAMDCCGFIISVYDPDPEDDDRAGEIPPYAIMCPNQPTWCNCGYDCVDEWDFCDCELGHECCGIL